jgi:tetratricopeptide (TPR) repeat protein
MAAGACAALSAGAPVWTGAQTPTTSGVGGATATGANPTASMESPPGPTVPASTPASLTRIEAWDRDLGAALAALAASRTVAAHRRAASEYLRLGIRDFAYRELNEAIKLDPADGDAYDARARIWRDWGFPERGLADAYRAAYFAPASAAPLNTLGTILQALGQRGEAKRAYEKALVRDPAATYALNNLCYLMLLERQFDEAASNCRRALAVDPDFKAARNNLGLALALSGHLDTAEQQFLEAAGPAGASYNLGLLYLADGQLARAKERFDAASRLDPSYEPARRRSRQTAELIWRAAAVNRRPSTTSGQ